MSWSLPRAASAARAGTDPNLARNIGDAVHRAWEGELDYTYSDEGKVLRVRWTR